MPIDGGNEPRPGDMLMRDVLDLFPSSGGEIMKFDPSAIDFTPGRTFPVLLGTELALA